MPHNSSQNAARFFCLLRGFFFVFINERVEGEEGGRLVSHDASHQLINNKQNRFKKKNNQQNTRKRALIPSQ